MTIETALVIIPPKSVQAFAYPIREEYDKVSFQQMPAHITLLYPFVGEDGIEFALQKLQIVCEGINPFELILDRYDRFKTVHFLTASKPEELNQLQQELSEAFPEFLLHSGEFGSTYVPHLTLAQFEREEDANQLELPPTPNFCFELSQIHLYLGDKEDEAPFIPRAVIHLGSKN